jgi:hypothetical protein
MSENYQNIGDIDGIPEIKEIEIKIKLRKCSMCDNYINISKSRSDKQV